MEPAPATPRGGEPRIGVAVCTARPAELVRAALESLARQRHSGDRLLLVTSGLSDAQVAPHRRLASELGAELVVESLPGLSRARNRALAALAEAPVVAFVDDDAIAAADWRERLGARWADAPSDVACIGGAVRARWERPPPRWVAGGVLHSFSLLDLGGGLVEVTPPRQEVYGVNVSFAAEALRAVGGFDVTRGAWRDVPLAGEESHVERLLVDRGWRVLYAGDVRVEHVIAADRVRLASMLRRRFYYGASGDEALGGPFTGAVRSIKAAVGTAVAAAARDPAAAGERAGRAAAYAGVALGPVVRRRLRRRGWPGGTVARRRQRSRF